MDVTIAVNDKGEKFGSYVLKQSTWKANTCDNILLPAVETFFHVRFCQESSIFGFHYSNLIIPTKRILDYNISFPENQCELITTDKTEVATLDDLMQTKELPCLFMKKPAIAI